MKTPPDFVDVKSPAIDAVCPSCRRRVIVGDALDGGRVLINIGASSLGLRPWAGRGLIERYWKADLHDCGGQP